MSSLACCPLFFSPPLFSGFSLCMRLFMRGFPVCFLVEENAEAARTALQERRRRALSAGRCTKQEPERVGKGWP